MKYSFFAFVAILFIFFFTRLYSITDSLFYLNDMGRDSLVLLDWQQTGKPPLLGPQTSALPFNQSAFYFYLLYPIFLLLNGSPFAALYTIDLFYLGVFSVAFYMIYRSKQKKVMIVYLVTLLLIILHPQFIIQNRFVWNPSFVGPLVLASFFIFYFLTQHFTRKKVILLGMTLALATSLSYSVIPAVIGFGVVSLLSFKKKVIWVGASLAGWLVFFNIPTLFFEFRHHFLLTQMMLHQPKIKQVNTDIISKWHNILSYMLTAPTQLWEKILAICFVLALMGLGYWYWKHVKDTNHSRSDDRLFISALTIFLVSLGLTLVLPIPILAHYIFGTVVLGCIVLAAMPGKLRMGMVILFAGVWGFSLLTQPYFSPAVRTVQQMEACYHSFCLEEKEPLFVSLQSGLLPFHNGPEHRYLLKKAGCDVKDIETSSSAAKTMAVVVESSEFTFGQTNYSELSAFNPQKLGKTYFCQPNLKIVTVTKD